MIVLFDLILVNKNQLCDKRAHFQLKLLIQVRYIPYNKIATIKSYCISLFH